MMIPRQLRVDRAPSKVAEFQVFAVIVQTGCRLRRSHLTRSRSLQQRATRRKTIRKSHRPLYKTSVRTAHDRGTDAHTHTQYQRGRCRADRRPAATRASCVGPVGSGADPRRRGHVSGQVRSSHARSAVRPTIRYTHMHRCVCTRSGYGARRRGALGPEIATGRDSAGPARPGPLNLRPGPARARSLRKKSGPSPPRPVHLRPEPGPSPLVWKTFGGLKST